MSSITYRQIIDGEPQWGQGQANFVADLTAVGLLILTRLKLFEGEWWADQLDGTPFWQSILGASGAPNNISAVTQLIVQRILATPFVQGINSLQESFNSATRTYNFYAVVDTQFGAITVSNTPVSVQQPIV